MLKKIMTINMLLRSAVCDGPSVCSTSLAQYLRIFIPFSCTRSREMHH
jgi:hypothetical protein